MRDYVEFVNWYLEFSDKRLSTLTEALLRKFQPIFYPRSIAMVGSFSRGRMMGAWYFNILLETGYKGNLYAVSRSGGEYHGSRVYADLGSIPDDVDLVYVCVPREQVLDLLDECAAKGVKAVAFFTAGFSELNEEGRALEMEMVAKARRGGFHIIGPNCIGPYSPEVRMMFTLPIFLGQPGDISFICQSGSLYVKTLQMGRVRGINYSKGISYGNGEDLGPVDFLQYLKVDPKTKAIVIYIEGIRSGRGLLEAAREVCLIKPVILIRGGRCEAGRRATLSHTGSLTSEESTWEALIQQTGMVMMDNMEEVADALLAFQKLGKYEGGVVALTGLVDGGGGEAVMAADILSLSGLPMPAFQGKTIKELENLLSPVGSILHNPLDVSQAYGDPSVIAEAAQIALKEPGNTTLVVLEYFDLMSHIRSIEGVREQNNLFIIIRERLGKKLVMVMPPALNEGERLAEEKRLIEAGVPVYSSMERAAKALYNLKRLSRID